MKQLLFYLILIVSAMRCAAETYAVIRDGTVVDFRNEPSGLIEAYRSDPAKSNKVAMLRLVVETPAPAVNLQQKAVQLDWVITDATATRPWAVLPLSAPEIAAANQDTAQRQAEALESRLRAGAWESGFLRLEILQTELLALVMKAMVNANFQTNLPVAERQRAADLRAEMLRVRDWFAKVRSNRTAVLASPTVVDPASLPALNGALAE